MSEWIERYEGPLMAAYVRGALRGEGPLFDMPLEALTEEDYSRLLALGREAELKLYDFKKKERLPRVKKTLGFLRGVLPESLLDIGSGRGVFLFPFLMDFPEVPVTSVDLLEHRVAVLNAVAQGGIRRLTALRQDITAWDMPRGAFDVVTALEVLEHIPNVQAAIRSAVHLARRYVVVTVPSKPDNNPEHIHLLTKPVLTDLFHAAGCHQLQFDGVSGHLFMTAKVDA